MTIHYAKIKCISHAEKWENRPLKRLSFLGSALEGISAYRSAEGECSAYVAKFADERSEFTSEIGGLSGLGAHGVSRQLMTN